MSVNVTSEAGKGRISTLFKGLAGYPPELLDIPNPPKSVSILGDKNLLGMPKVAIVGTRSPTGYGTRIARELASQLADSGVCIVSGMARGIDSAAHWGAIEAGGKSLGVLGTSVDIPYPATNRPLYNRLAADGLVLSEFAAARPAFPGCFPRRNRIIAGLSRVTFVIEAGQKSGALNTASHALEMGRQVAAIPGQIDCPQAAGSNLLLRDGAMMITCIADALMLAGVDARPVTRNASLSPGEQKVWDALAGEGKDLDSIAAVTRLPARECMQAVSSLELLGLVECLLTGEVRRR